MHGEELPCQALQFLPTHALLGDRDFQEVPAFLELALCEGYRYRLGANNPPEDIPDALPMSLPVQELLDQHRVLGLLGQQGENTFESTECAVKYSVLLLCPPCTAAITSSM